MKLSEIQKLGLCAVSFIKQIDDNAAVQVEIAFEGPIMKIAKPITLKIEWLVRSAGQWGYDRGGDATERSAATLRELGAFRERVDRFLANEIDLEWLLA